MTNEIGNPRGQLCRLIQGEICTCDGLLLSVGVSEDDAVVQLRLALLRCVQWKFLAFCPDHITHTYPVVSRHISSFTIRVFFFFSSSSSSSKGRLIRILTPI